MEPRLAALPRPIREQLSHVRDADLDTDPSVIDARAALREANDRHDAAARVSGHLREKIAEGERRLEELTAAIGSIDDVRPALAARILLGSAMDREDADSQARRGDLARRAEALAAGLPILRGELQGRATSVRYSSEAVTSAAEQLEEALFDARIARATQLAA